jgi:hypothetical protein
MALFGSGSFIASRLNNQEAFLYDYLRDSSGYWPSWTGTCVEQVPFQNLLDSALDETLQDSGIDYCIMNDVADWGQIDAQLAAYVLSFMYNEEDDLGGERIQNAFRAAVFLATEAWLMHNDIDLAQFSLQYDGGADTLIPTMSRTGIIVVSLLLGVDIACLLALAIYSATQPRWTSQLDAFAMMRIGAAMHEKLPFRVDPEFDEVRVLDETSGFIGDVTGGEGKFGELGLETHYPVQRKRLYRSY